MQTGLGVLSAQPEILEILKWVTNGTDNFMEKSNGTETLNEIYP